MKAFLITFLMKPGVTENDVINRLFLLFGALKPRQDTTVKGGPESNKKIVVFKSNFVLVFLKFHT